MRSPIAGVVLAIALTAGACANEADGPDGAPTTVEDTTSTTAEAACAPDDLDPAELEALTVDDLPAGYERQPDDVGDTGPSDLAKAIRDDGHDDAEQVLTDLRFRRGYQWLWDDGAGSTLISFVYEFCDGDGAEGYVERGQALTEAEATGVDSFDVPALDEEATAVGTGDGDYQFAYVDVVEGPFYIRVMTFTQPPAPSTAGLEERSGALAIAQLAEVEDFTAEAA